MELILASPAIAGIVVGTALTVSGFCIFLLFKLPRKPKRPELNAADRMQSRLSNRLMSR